MKQKYLAWVVAGCLLGQQARAQVTAWRPFNPGRIYSFALAGSSASTAALHALRVDSAYATGGDSVYTFNRLLRTGSSSFVYRKSRNNLFGARLRWQPGTSGYYLEANAEAATGTTTPTNLLLYPRAATGRTWLASTQPVLTATVSQRSTGLVGTLPDSLATITLSNGQTLIVSKHYGLVQGPQWLALTGGASAWQQWTAPQPGLGDYDPRVLFALNRGDELGYELTQYAAGSAQLVCTRGYELLSITSRQLTADSLILSYVSKSQSNSYNIPGCAAPGSYTSLALPGRWAISLRTGQSPQLPLLGLLAGEYRTVNNQLLTGLTEAIRPATTCLSSTRTLAFIPVYPAAGQPTSYTPGVDYQSYRYEFSASLGTGPITRGSSVYTTNELVYYRRAGISCGSRTNFDALPTRAAQAAQVATLHPNPATDQATLTLAAPAPTGTTISLTDAVGRQLWSAPVAPGQVILSIPLAGRPTGLYLLQLAFPGQPHFTYKFTAVN